MRPNRRDMPSDFRPKQMKLKRGDVRVRTRGGLTALVWKDKREVYMLTNTDPPPAEGNSCDDSNCPLKPNIVERYNRHMGYVDNSDGMANSYSMIRRTFKWTTKLFSHFLDLTVRYRYLHVRLNIPTEISGYFWWGIWTRWLERAKFIPHPDWLEDQVRAQNNVLRLESHHIKHWPAKSSTQLRCHLCSSRGQRKRTVSKRARCDVGLCVVPCFEEYHTKVNL